jgi:hypothetical protein
VEEAVVLVVVVVLVVLVVLVPVVQDNMKRVEIVRRTEAGEYLAEWARLTCTERMRMDERRLEMRKVEEEESKITKQRDGRGCREDVNRYSSKIRTERDDLEW